LIFYCGGAAGLAIGGLALVGLPESLRFLAGKPHRRRELSERLRGIGIPTVGNEKFVLADERPALGHGRFRVQELFEGQLRWLTPVLWGTEIIAIFARLEFDDSGILAASLLLGALVMGAYLALAGFGLLSDRDKLRGEETLAAVRAAGGAAQFLFGDITSEPFVQHLVDAAVETYGRLDCAFNNAGITGTETVPVDQFTLEAWQNVITVNLTTVFLCLKYETRAMLKTGGGAIVNTASGLGHVATYNMPAYCASKAGIIGLTRATALDYATRNIRVNTVLPAVIETPMTTDGLFVKAPELVQALLEQHPIGRFGQADEVAAAVLWLNSGKASFVTGHAMMVDGAYTTI
jgi:NAD(P)-dependent dehydrogenase (short-subunit alcohol dehydrogenase family)